MPTVEQMRPPRPPRQQYRKIIKLLSEGYRFVENTRIFQRGIRYNGYKHTRQPLVKKEVIEGLKVYFALENKTNIIPLNIFQAETLIEKGCMVLEKKQMVKGVIKTFYIWNEEKYGS